MKNSSGQPNRPKRHDSTCWAQPVSTLKVADTPPGAINLNVEGRHVVGPLQGFGQLWQKTYQVRLSGVKVTPVEVIKIWKENFPKFQPPENHFYPSLAGVRPGEVIFIDSTLPAVPGLPGLIPISSGVMVLYTDDESFTVMTPQGFPESGWNTFSAFEKDGCTVAQVQSIARATDPIYEFGFHFMGGSRFQEETWDYVLRALAARFAVEGQVQMVKSCLDSQLQWSEVRNVWYNAAIRTALYTPVYFIRKMLKR